MSTYLNEYVFELYNLSASVPERGWEINVFPLTSQQSLSETRAGYNLIQPWNESVQDCFMGGVHVAVKKIISPPNHCRLAAICVSRFDGPMLMAFSGLSTDVFFFHTCFGSFSGWCVAATRCHLIFQLYIFFCLVTWNLYSFKSENKMI